MKWMDYGLPSAVPILYSSIPRVRRTKRTGLCRTFLSRERFMGTLLNSSKGGEIPNLRRGVPTPASAGRSEFPANYVSIEGCSQPLLSCPHLVCPLRLWLKQQHL
jgi:hypothetical protein